MLYNAGNSMEGIAIAVGCLHHALHLYEPDILYQVVQQDADSPCLAEQLFSGTCFAVQCMIRLTQMSSLLSIELCDICFDLMKALCPDANEGYWSCVDAYGRMCSETCEAQELVLHIE